jgi:hypothetical protein
MLELDQEIKMMLPELYDHLANNDFDIEYFAMRWIMDLFSQDLDKKILLSFWDILCQTDIKMLTYFVISILKTLERLILSLEGN